MKSRKFPYDAHDVVMLTRTLVELLIFVIINLLPFQVKWITNFPQLNGLKIGVSAALLSSLVFLVATIYYRYKNKSIKVITYFESIADAILIIWLIFVFGGMNGTFFFFFFLALMESAFTLNNLVVSIVILMGIVSTIADYGFQIYTKTLFFNFQSFLFLFFRILAIGLIGYYSYSFMRSIVREKEVSRKLQKAYRNIKVLSKIKTEFLRVVSHQLRTPVSIVKGMASMLAEGSVKDNKREDFIKKLYLSSERLTAILDDILVAQGLIGGVEVVSLSPCQIEEIVEKQINHLKPLAESKSLEIQLKKPNKKIPVTFVDPEMISKAIGRIIDNAILYTEKQGKIKINVRLRKKDGKNFIEISVKDSGIGLNKKDKENLFKVFYRGEKATLLYPNASGLGLFIVKKFIEIHDGKIKAESKGRGKGSNFIITLPIINRI
jgi:signal transduction histidine kinase